MQDYWKILGIESGADLRTIKRAYAAKLKTIRQDENPTAFMALREAYESAKYSIEYQGASEGLNVVGTEWEQATKYVEEPETQSVQNQSLPQIMDDIRALMKNPWGKNDTASWQSVFEDERLDALDDFTNFEHNLFKYLLDIHGFYSSEQEQNSTKPNLTMAVADLIFTHFNWHKSRRNSDEIDWLATQLQLSSPANPKLDWFSKAQVDKRRYDNVLKDLTDSNDSNWHELIIPVIIGIATFICIAIIIHYSTLPQ